MWALRCLISRPQILNLRSQNQIRGKSHWMDEFVCNVGNQIQALTSKKKHVVLVTRFNQFKTVADIFKASFTDHN